MNHPKHRKYRLVINLDNHSIVQDLETLDTHKCFYLENSKVGDEFYLYEKERNIFSGAIIFEYSILNLYEVGKEYEFAIIDRKDKVLVVSSFKNIHFAIPAFFEEKENQKVIKLKVSELNYDENKLIFESKKIEKEVEDYSDFEEGKVYSLEVVNKYTNKNGNTFVNVVYNRHHYHVFLYDNMVDLIKVGDKVEVYRKEYEGHQYSLNITRHFQINKLYQINKKYQFKIVDQAYEKGSIYWVVEDVYGLRHYYNPNMDITYDETISSLKIGDLVSFFVLSVSPRGYLELVYELKDWGRDNYLVEDVFSYIGYDDKEDEYFFKYFKEYRESEEESCGSFDKQYNEGNNLWVFSYLAFLDEKIYQKLDEGSYTDAKTFIDIYLKIENWILEGSNFLKNFSSYKVKEIIIKAESKINKLNSTIKAIDIYLNGEEQDYVQKIKDTFSKTPYLSSDRKGVFKELIKLSQYFNADSNDEIFYDALILLIRHKDLIENDDILELIEVIESRISRISSKVSELNTNNIEFDNSSGIKDLILNQYLLVLLYAISENKFKSIISSANLLKYLSIYHKDILYLDLAIKVILKQEYLMLMNLAQSEIFKLSASDLEHTTKEEEDEVRYYSNAGLVKYSKKGFEFTPNNLWMNLPCVDTKSLFKFNGFDLYINSDYDIVTLSNSISTLEYIKEVSSIISYKSVEESYEVDVDFSKDYYGKVKPINNSKFCFLTSAVEGKKKDVLLHISAFQKSAFFDNVSQFIKKGDVIKFRVVGVNEDKLNVGVQNYLENFSEKVLVNDEYKTLGIVVKNQSRFLSVITKEGYPVAIQDDKLKEGDVIKITIDDYDTEYNNYLATKYSISTEEFDHIPEELYRQYLISSGVIEKQCTLLYDNTLNIYANILVGCIEQRLNFIDEPIELIKHYFTLIVLSGIVKSNKSYMYNIKLNHLIEVIRLESSEDIDLLNTSLPENYRDHSFENLVNENHGFKLLKYINSKELDIPLDFERESPFYKLKKLVESYNLVNTYYQDYEVDKLLKKIIVRELYNITIKAEINNTKVIDKILDDIKERGVIERKDEVPKVITNLGVETKNKEFKSSIFYSASDVPQSKVILKTIAGFLNSYDEKGGSLFIGVNDSGDIIGLDKDLRYDPSVTNLDQYQNYIQNLVVSAFPKEINAMLTFKFHKSKKLDYLEIIVPSHYKPVSLGDDFYQRQGVQTRLLKGTDITDFMSNKFNSSSKSVILNTLKNENDKTKKVVISDSINENSYGNKDFYTDLKEKGEIQDNNKNIEEDNLLANLYIFDDNTYVVTSSEINRYKFKVAITEKYKYGHLLLCYDNACVNKVEIRSIINKTHNKRYMNATSESGELLAVELILSGELIGVLTKRFGILYLKVFEVDKISEHKIIGLKGNGIVQADFDKLESYYFISRLPFKFQAFRRDSKQGLGADISKNEYLFQEFKEFIKYQ